MEKTEKQVELGDKVVGTIELPSLDISPYVGKKIEIESVKEYEGSYGFYIRMFTKVIEVLDGKDGRQEMLDDTKKPVELRASRLFGLQEDAEGKIGWGDKTKLAVFLKKYGAAHYRDMVGKEVLTTSVTNSDSGKDFVSFN